MSRATLRGRVLVATPVIGDPNFFQTVVLILDHTDEGTAGVVLNRPSDTSVADALPAWSRLAAEPPVVFVGGPVQPTGAVALGRLSGSPPDGWDPVLGPLGTIDLTLGPDASGVDAVRVFAGYAGWGAGQLDAELDAEAWAVLDADPEDVLTPEPDGLWRLLLRRAGGRLAMMATFPLDPATN